MTNGRDLTKTQFKTLATVLCRVALSDTAEVSEYDARTNGAHLASLEALVRKGFLVRRTAPFVMPEGPYAGETFEEWFYSVAE